MMPFGLNAMLLLIVGLVFITVSIIYIGIIKTATRKEALYSVVVSCVSVGTTFVSVVATNHIYSTEVAMCLELTREMFSMLFLIK